jgi:signal peptidase I
MMASEAELKDTDRGGDSIYETLRVIVHALILAAVVRIFLFQPFSIPSGSMIPTLLVGDYLFVSKYSYGFSKHSFPWSPDMFSGRVWAAEPKRGDVVVFKFPRDNSTDYIKRLIGLPGEKIQIIDGVLHINGNPVALKPVDDYVGPGSTCQKRVSSIRVPRYVETLPNGVSHQILKCAGNTLNEADNAGPFTVPPGHYFMMGDNRDNSTDSRFGPDDSKEKFVRRDEGVAYVPAENLIGRADMLFFSVDETAGWFAPWRWASEVRWSRFFNIIR